MKRCVFAVLLSAALPVSGADAAVAVSVGQPGFYGRIDIGNAPPPQLIYTQPVIIQKVHVVQPLQPIYLHVPPGHAHKWSKHCHKYGACNRPVLFVKDDWYQTVYVPHYQKSHGGPSGNTRGKGHGKGKDK